MSVKGINKNENNGMWRGNNATVASLHCWIRENFKKPTKCDLCGTNKKRLEWSNKDHLYSRNRKDWQHICRSCHNKYDKRYNNRKFGSLKIRKGGWSIKYDGCLLCKSSKNPLRGQGLCRKCYYKKNKA